MKQVVWFVLAVLTVIGAGVAIAAGVSGTPGRSATATLLGGTVPTESAPVTYADLRAMLLTPTGSHQAAMPLARLTPGMCDHADTSLGTYDGAESQWSSKLAGGALETLMAVSPNGAVALFHELVAEVASPTCTASAGNTQPGAIRVRTVKLSLPQVGDQSAVVSTQLPAVSNAKRPSTTIYFLVARFDTVLVQFAYWTTEPSHLAGLSFLTLMDQVATKINAELAHLAKYGNPRNPPIPSAAHSLQVFIDPQAPSSASTEVGALLRASRGIVSCRYLDHLQSWILAERIVASDPDAAASLTPAETPPMFLCQLRPGANESKLLSQLRKVPGVFQALDAVQRTGSSGL